MTQNDLQIFLDAQAPVYDDVTAELAAGRKTSHWMWFIFPQLAGLGRSATARRFAIRDLDHARRYLAHPVLGGRLRECAGLLLRHRGLSACRIFGSPDDVKLRSSLTLFLQIASAKSDKTLFSQLLGAFYAGEPDPLTLSLIGGGGR